MPRGKWIDKKTAQHFTLVHRPQNDPLIYDESAPSMVLNPTRAPNAGNGKKLDDLASELGSEAEQIRANEGEAANYGVFYDDTEYDYMQHLRDLGSGGGEAVFVPSTTSQDKDKSKGKQKQSLEDALRELDLSQQSKDLFDDDFLPSKNLKKATYQSQQDVPDAIAGFQPDMDPRLREVLEALEDDAYVDDQDDDVFQELAKEGKEISPYEFEDQFEDDDEGWESDDTARPKKEFRDEEEEAPRLVSVGEQPEEGPSQDWLADFKQFKKDQKPPKKPLAASQSDVQSSVWTTTTTGGRKKKRKGALTAQTGFSMTSSSLVRTEQLTILDARFDKIEEEYTQDMDDVGSVVSGLSTMSSVQGTTRADFDGIMDEFLGSYSMRGKRTVRRGKGQSGVAELDEIRKGLGPARLRQK